jgi:hypothetical protein
MTLISRMKWNTRFRAVKFIRVIGVIRGLLFCSIFEPMLNARLAAPNKLAACSYGERAARVIGHSAQSWPKSLLVAALLC